MSNLKAKTQILNLRKTKLGTFNAVYHIVKRIQAGRVMTYGEIAKELGINPRVVGWALHANRDKSVPCYRVVDRNGRLAPNYGFGGWREQKRRLTFEGVKFLDEGHVDLKKSEVNG